MSKRRTPKAKDRKERLQHSRDHAGQMGKYAKIYTEDVPLWTPSSDDHEVAIIPYLVKENTSFRKNPDLNMPFSGEELENGRSYDHKLTALIHYGIGVNEDHVLCLRTVGKPCPICEDAERLKRDDPDDKDGISDRTPAKRALYNIVVFDSEKEFGKGIQVWESPHKSIEDVLAEDESVKKSRETGEVEEKDYGWPEEGWNVCFTRKGKGKNDTEYKSIKIEKRTSKQEFTRDELDELFAGAYNFEDIIEVKSYDEIYEMHHGTAPGESPFSGDDKERGEDTDGDGKEDTRDTQESTSRFRGEDKDTEPEEEEKPRGTRKPKSEDKCPVKDGTFGESCNTLSECDDCVDDTFDACYKAKQKNLRN